MPLIVGGAAVIAVWIFHIQIDPRTAVVDLPVDDAVVGGEPFAIRLRGLKRQTGTHAFLEDGLQGVVIGANVGAQLRDRGKIGIEFGICGYERNAAVRGDMAWPYILIGAARHIVPAPTDVSYTQADRI